MTLFTFIFLANMANIISDVEHLRQQYNAGKSQHNGLIIQYNNKPFQDGDELKKSDTQIEPKVQINIETDPQNPYFTLVNKYSSLYSYSVVCFFYLDHG